MYIENNNKSNHLDTLTIPEVAEKINAKDNETAKKWLINNGIKIHKFTKNAFVYQVEVASEIDKPFVLHLRSEHPEKWKELYRDVVKDLAVYNLLISKLEENPSPKPTVRARRVHKKDEKRYKDLLE